MTAPTLHMICGKIAAGKSLLAARLSAAETTVRISEDDWLGGLFGDRMQTPGDYVTYSAKLQGVVGPHVVNLLEAGVTVVLDFAANTVAQRQWMRGILDQTTAAHQLHVLDVPDEICLARLRDRNAQGDHPFAATEAQFHAVTRHLVLPTAEEGFNIVRHGPDG